LKKSGRFSFPLIVVVAHTAAILFFMFALWNRWFLTDIPFDCFYGPFFFISGPVVYFVAHTLQHWSEQWFPSAGIMVHWNLVPGATCLILGGLQWWLIAHAYLWIRNIRSKRSGGQQATIR
jgi:hypothetical protein